LPSSAKALGNNRWRVRLGPGHLPQRIEVAFQGAAQPGQRNRFTVAAPILESLPVERTLWTVQGPRSAGSGRIVAAASEVDGLRLDHLRLSTIASLISLASEIVAQNAQQETADWYVAWARRVAAARRRIVDRIDPDDQQAMAEIADIDEQQRSIAERLGTVDVLQQVLEENPFPADPGDWYGTPWQQGPPVYGTLLGASDVLELEYPNHHTSFVGARLLSGLLITLIALLLYASAPASSLWNWLVGRPQFTLILAGIVWWMWGTPSILGVVLIVIGGGWQLWLLAQFDAPVAREPEEITSTSSL
jgi:hypothetical protein